MEIHVVTLALGSQRRQGVARLWAKWETRESHHMLLGVQRVWGNQPSHSQVNSHGGNWSPKWTLETSKSNFKSQNSMNCDVLYIIGKLLERKYLKWACIVHLDIWNTSYGRRKGRESNWQFVSRPQKVENQLDTLVYKGHATYRWKALDWRSSREIMGLQSRKSPNLGDFGTPTWESRDKKRSFGCGLCDQPYNIL
jgi:hypothetical protein